MHSLSKNREFCRNCSKRMNVTLRIAIVISFDFWYDLTGRSRIRS